MLLLSPGLTLAIFGLAESSGHGFDAPRAWIPIVAGVLLVAAFLRHSWTSSEPLIDIRTFTHTRAGPAAGTFMLFGIAMFGSLLLVPLYYQAVRGDSALQSGLLLAPQGLGAMITMPIAGRLTDRVGATQLAAFGIPLGVIGMSPFAFLTEDTSYVLLSAGGFVLGLGMGMSFMPLMTAAMQAVPPQAIARTSTAMNIIRQTSASIGTAILSVILSSAIVDELSGTAGAGQGAERGFESLHGLSPAQRAVVAGPLADAFASTFVWGVALLALAFVPALALALGGRRDVRTAAAPPATPAEQPVAAD
jgi:MFS family permease